jgi:hypothetical protein
MQQQHPANPEGAHHEKPLKATGSVDEETLKIEDATCLKFNLASVYQLRDIISRKNKALSEKAVS